MPTVPAQPAGLHSARSARSCSASSAVAAASGCLCAEGALDGLLGDVDRRLVVELGDVGGHPTLGLDQVVGREDGVGPRIPAALGGPGVEHDPARLDTAQDVDDGAGFQARSDGVKGHETVERLVPGPHRVVHGEARRAERPGDQHPPCLPLVELTARQVGEARLRRPSARTFGYSGPPGRHRGPEPPRPGSGRPRPSGPSPGPPRRRWRAARCTRAGPAGRPSRRPALPGLAASSAHATPGSRPGPPSGSAGALAAPPR